MRKSSIKICRKAVFTILYRHKKKNFDEVVIVTKIVSKVNFMFIRYFACLFRATGLQ